MGHTEKHTLETQKAQQILLRATDLIRVSKHPINLVSTYVATSSYDRWFSRRHSRV